MTRAKPDSAVIPEQCLTEGISPLPGTSEAAKPFYVNGTGGFAAEAIQAGPGTFRVKNGTGGIFAAALPALGPGVALKIGDGAMRAAECATAHILREFCCLDASQEPRLAPFLNATIKTNAGQEAGAIRLAFTLKK